MAENEIVKGDVGHIRGSRFAVVQRCKPAVHVEPERSFPMKQLMIAGFVAVALLASATIALRSHSLTSSRAAVTTGMASAKNSQTTTGANKLPVEEFEDMSLVFSTKTKQ